MTGYYRSDSHLSAPQSERVVGVILARAKGPDGRPEPLELRFGFSPAWVLPYQVLARRLHHAELSIRAGAPHQFFVGARDALELARPFDPRRVDLETIFVVGR